MSYVSEDTFERVVLFTVCQKIRPAIEPDYYLFCLQTIKTYLGDYTIFRM